MPPLTHMVVRACWPSDNRRRQLPGAECVCGSGRARHQRSGGGKEVSGLLDDMAAHDGANSGVSPGIFRCTQCENQVQVVCSRWLPRCPICGNDCYAPVPSKRHRALAWTVVLDPETFAKP